MITKLAAANNRVINAGIVKTTLKSLNSTLKLKQEQTFVENERPKKYFSTFS